MRLAVRHWRCGIAPHPPTIYQRVDPRKHSASHKRPNRKTHLYKSTITRHGIERQESPTKTKQTHLSLIFPQVALLGTHTASSVADV